MQESEEAALNYITGLTSVKADSGSRENSATASAGQTNIGCFKSR